MVDLVSEYRVYPVSGKRKIAPAKRVRAEHQREALHKGLVHVRPADEAILPLWEQMTGWRVDLMDRTRVVDYWTFDKRLWMTHD